jgi:hypothetical protein
VGWGQKQKRWKRQCENPNTYLGYGHIFSPEKQSVDEMRRQRNEILYQAPEKVTVRPPPPRPSPQGRGRSKNGALFLSLPPVGRIGMGVRNDTVALS